jgi:acyl-CoA thioester hydrolase
MSHFIHRLEVRFRDCDPMGHVNNAVYFTYLEQTRLAHWRSTWGFAPRPAQARLRSSESETSADPPDMLGVIIAHAECDYRRAARFGEMLEVRMRVADIGRTSFKYEYEIVDAQGRTVATARSVQVMYDYATEKPVPIPDNIRALLAPRLAGC